MKRWQIIFIILLAILFSGRMLTRHNFHEVIPSEIYRSAQLSGKKLEKVVKDHGIKTVISLRRPRPNKKWYRDEIATAESAGIAHHDIGLDLTFSPRIDHLLELRNLIENATRPLLVHCRAGADRTGLASMMVKLMDGSSSLEEVRAQVSWKFHAFRKNSLGIPFFDEYSAWLESSGRVHSKLVFNHWLENEYIDLSGNIHFLVDAIQEQVWRRPWGLIEEGFEFRVNRSGLDSFDLSGWAFDTRSISLLEGIEVYLGDVRFEKSQYGINQPWLIKDFGKEEYLFSGWTASHPMSELDNGCHQLVLKFNRLDGSNWVSPPAGRICIY